MSSTVLFQIQSIIIFSSMTIGIYFRKKPAIHMRIMSVAIIWDILLVAQIEITRAAILKASKVLTNPLLLNIHVTLAVTCVLLYFFMIYSGRKISLGDRHLKKRLHFLGIITYIIRLVTLITSFCITSMK